MAIKPAFTKRLGLGVLIGASLLIMAMSVYIQFRTGYYGDKQWELLYSRMWLDGKILYKDIFPVSPPLIFWLYAAPVILSRHAPFTDYQALVALGLLVTAFSIFLCTRLMALTALFRESRSLRWQYAALLCYVLVFRTNPTYFLDRESLFLILIFPYVTRFLPSVRHEPVSPRLSLLIGLLAGLGFCIKPYCLIVWLGVQLLYMRADSWRGILLSVENVAIYLVSVAYILLVAAATPDYIGIVMPMALLTYSATRDLSPFWDYAANALYALVLALAMFRPRHASPFRADIYFLLGLCPFLVLYILANNNWAYTYYPLSTMVLFATGFLYWEFAWLRTGSPDRKAVKTFNIGMLLCLGAIVSRVFITLNYYHMVYIDTCSYNPVCRADDKMIDELRAGGEPPSFGAISIDFTRWTRLVDLTGAKWETRFPQLWMLPKFFISGEGFTEKHRWILDYVSSGFAEDLDRNKPRVLFVDDSDVFYSAALNVDLIYFLSANPKFREAMTHYGFVRDINLCDAPGIVHTPYKIKCSYHIYRRLAQ